MAVRSLVMGVAFVLVAGLAVIGCVVYQDREARDRDSRARAALDTVLRASGYSVAVRGLDGPVEEEGIGTYVYLSMDGTRGEAAAVCTLVAATSLYGRRPEQVRVEYGPRSDDAVKCD
jgi:hypothetical protein